MLWNIAVYALLAVHWVLQITGARPCFSEKSAALAHVDQAARVCKHAGPTAAAKRCFVTQWSE